MLNQCYPDSRTVPAEPRDVIAVLQEDYHVPDPVILLLSDAVARRVGSIVDKALAQKAVPQSYYIVRQLQPEWLR
jgi:hypothetical protein